MFIIVIIIKPLFKQVGPAEITKSLFQGALQPIASSKSQYCIVNNILHTLYYYILYITI